MRCLIPILLLFALSPGASRGADYILRAESRLEMDRWRGATVAPVERTDVRQWLGLQILDLTDDPRRPVSFVADLEIGADFGAPPEASAMLSDGRRTRLDLHRASLHADLGVVDLTAGRHARIDEVGWDTLDGLTARLRVAPFLVLEATGGLAARRGWSDFGPDIYSADGTALSDRAGVVLGAALETRQLDWLHVRAAYRREADDAVQSEDAGIGLDVSPLRGAWLEGGARYDTIFRRFSSLRAGANGRLAEDLRAGAEWRRERPTFSADSIWGAFSANPYDDASARARWTPGRWRFVGDAGVRFFDAGEEAAQSPGLPLGAPPEAPAGPSDPGRAFDGGLRATRLLSPDDPRFHAGLEGRIGRGYGGDRLYGDVFGQVPIPWAPGDPPIWLRGRLGAVNFEDPGASELGGISGWGLLAARWAPAETIDLDLLAEGHSSRYTPVRVRIMGRAVLREWL